MDVTLQIDSYIPVSVALLLGLRLTDRLLYGLMFKLDLVLLKDKAGQRQQATCEKAYKHIIRYYLIMWVIRQHEILKA